MRMDGKPAGPASREASGAVCGRDSRDRTPPPMDNSSSSEGRCS